MGSEGRRDTTSIRSKLLLGERVDVLPEAGGAELQRYCRGAARFLPGLPVRDWLKPSDLKLTLCRT